MKVATIIPAGMAEQLSPMSDYHMCLGHICLEDNEYANHYAALSEAGDFVLLDNSAYELKSGLDNETMLNLAMLIKPAALFLQDVRFNMSATIKSTVASLAFFRSISGYKGKLLAVPQGKNFGEVMACMETLIAKGVDGFGLYEEIGQVTGKGQRADFIEHLDQVLTGRIKEKFFWHCLGMEEDIEQLRRLAKFKWLHGVDSVKPVVYALQQCDLALKQPTIYLHRPTDYFDIQWEDFDLKTRELIRSNISYCIKISEGTE